MKNSPDHIAKLRKFAVKGNLSELKKLFDEDKVDTLARGNNGQTPLHWAAVGGAIETAQWLFAMGVDDINSRTAIGDESVLHYAVKGERRSIALVEWLCEKGADITARTTNGHTVLDYASGDPNNKGMPFTVVRGHEKTLFGLGLPEFIRELLAIYVSEFSRLYQCSVLHQAVRGGFSQCALDIIHHGHVDTLTTDQQQRTALHYAAQMGNAIIVKQILEKCPADKIQKLMATVDSSGQTVLHAVARAECGSTKKVILNAMINKLKECEPALPDQIIAEIINMSDQAGETLWHHVAKRDITWGSNEEILEQATKQAGDLQKRNHSGLSPLDLICFQQQERGFKLLEKYGYNPMAKNSAGDNALHMAVKKNKLEAVNWLCQWSRKSARVETGSIQRLSSELLIEDSLDKDEKTPLHLAAKCGYLRIMKYLLGQKAETTQTVDQYGQNPLHQAIKGNQPAIARYLLEANALRPIDLNANCKKGKSPLRYAVEIRDAGLVQLLLTKGAVPAVSPVDGKSLLHVAAEHKCLKVFKILIGDERIDIHATDREGYSALDHAADLSLRYEFLDSDHAVSLAMVNLLIDKGARVSNCNADFSLLHAAVELAIAAVNNTMGQLTPIWSTAQQKVVLPRSLRTPNSAAQGALSILEKLLDDGQPNLERLDQYGRSALMFAIEASNLPVVDLLLTKGASTAGCRRDGKSLLYVALQTRNLEIIKRLMAIDGLDVNQVEADGSSALFLSFYQTLASQDIVNDHAILDALLHKYYQNSIPQECFYQLDIPSPTYNCILDYGPITVPVSIQQSTFKSEEYYNVTSIALWLFKKGSCPMTKAPIVINRPENAHELKRDLLGKLVVNQSVAREIAQEKNINRYQKITVRVMLSTLNRRLYQQSMVSPFFRQSDWRQNVQLWWRLRGWRKPPQWGGSIDHNIASGTIFSECYALRIQAQCIQIYGTLAAKARALEVLMRLPMRIGFMGMKKATLQAVVKASADDDFPAASGPLRSHAMSNHTTYIENTAASDENDTYALLSGEGGVGNTVHGEMQHLRSIRLLELFTKRPA